MATEHCVQPRTRRWRSILLGVCGGLAIIALLVYFWPILFGGELYYPGDTARQYLPSRVELVQALSDRAFPWWTSNIGAGYPLLAEGETGAMYPFHWLVILLFSAGANVTASILLHTIIALLGMWLFLRSEGISPLSSLVGAMVVGFGGFYIAHISHLSLYCTAAWLPWLLWLITKCFGEHRGGARIALGVIVALQFYAGHAQASLLSAGLCAAWVLYCWARKGWKTGLRGVVGISLAVVGGTAVALPQLLPTLQLSQLSERAGGVSSDFFTSYSFHPGMILTLLHPFVLGNPYPTGSVEVMGYVGLFTLFAAGSALFCGRSASRWFWLAVALVGLFLALGEYNPLYTILLRIPVLNMFRVPARYLMWTTISLAVLAAQGCDSLLQPSRRWKEHLQLPVIITTLVVLASSGVIAIALTASSTDALVSEWPWIAILMFFASASVVWLIRVWGQRGILVACLVLFADLYAYGTVLGGGFNATVPAAEIDETLQTEAFLDEQPGLFRVMTKEEILPALSVQRESLYPNMALGTDIDSANIYMPLVPSAYSEYLVELDATALNQLNVGYFIIPQLLPVDAQSELYDVQDPFSDIPYNEWLSVSGTTANSLIIESYLSHSVDIPTGTPVAVIELELVDGTVREFELLAGVHTSEWAYARSDVQENILHDMAQIYSAFQARSGYPAEDHSGYTYRAEFALEGLEEIASIRITPLLAEAYVRIESLSFVQDDGTSASLEHLIGMAEHSIVYRSEDALVYKNLDAWPRAYTISADLIHGDIESVSLTGNTVDDLAEAVVVDYSDMRAEFAVNCESDCLFVLADMEYPGWQASVDGELQETIVVEGLYRGLWLKAGYHNIIYSYEFAYPGVN